MTGFADLATAVLAREMLAAGEDGMRVLAVTTVSSLVAGLTANRLGAALGLATGFGTLDAPAVPTLTLGDAALGTAESPVGSLSDAFVALARGRIGVVVSPAQVDAGGALNLSRIGGSDERPGVALPGSRGLPENNHSPSRVWILLGAHTRRALVPTVDFRSAPPPVGRVRRMLTPLGLFELGPSGWRALGLVPGVSADAVAAATGFAVEIAADCPALAEPSGEEAAALDAVDPHRLRQVEFLPGAEAASRFAEVVALERGSSGAGS